MKTRKDNGICGINHHRGASNPCEICGKVFPAQPQHTPTPEMVTPWKVVNEAEEVYRIRNTSGMTTAIASYKEHAAYIVRAVNAYEKDQEIKAEFKLVLLHWDCGDLAEAVRALASVVKRAEAK